MRISTAGLGGLLVMNIALAATEEDLFALSLEELGKVEVSIATGTPKFLHDAPAAATVITAADLKTMGAQTLDEALETVPGLHVSRGSFNYAPRYFMRGIVSTYNPQTLLLVNGLPQTGLFTSDRGERIGNRYSLPVEAIERIEVMRGPGSALYGADAFAGVINVITKGPDDSTGTNARVSAGSFKTGTASLQQAGTVGPVRSLFSLAWYQTAGDHDAIINSDAQSNLDVRFSPFPPVSLAPGPVNTSNRSYDARLDLIWGEFRLRSSWMRAWDIGTGQGLNEALDTRGRVLYKKGSADLSWQRPQLSPNWGIDARLSYYYNSFDVPRASLLYPPGAFAPLPPPGFPQGVLFAPSLKENNIRAEVTALYTGWSAHRLRLGSGVLMDDVFEIGDSRNWMWSSSGPFPITPRPGGMQDVSNTPEAYMPANIRRSGHVFAQDEWALAKQWELTTGVRYDYFDDVGDTTNPRLALVWTTTPTLTSKLLYGEAFRAPAFTELYVTSNPVGLGNPALKPERLRNTELAFNWRPLPAWALDLNVYQFRIRDYIDFLNDPGAQTYTARNASRINGQGLETEIRHHLNEQLQLLANYSHQRTEDRSTHAPLGIAPTAEAYLRAAWAFAPGWQFTPQLNWTGERKRSAGDPRTALDGYTSLDFSLRKTWPANIELALISRNLFDADIREPSRGPRSGQPLPTILNDLPQQGRSITLEASLRW